MRFLVALLILLILPGLALGAPAPPPAVEKKPQQVVEEFYSWIFQVSVPVPWQEVVRNRRTYLTDILWGTLREKAVRGQLDFDPFLDSESSALSYKVLACEQKGERAMVSVSILGTKGPGGKHDRKITVQVDHELDGWKIANIYYQWAQQDDLLSLCRRRQR